MFIALKGWGIGGGGGGRFVSRDTQRQRCDTTSVLSTSTTNFKWTTIHSHQTAINLLRVSARSRCHHQGVLSLDNVAPSTRSVAKCVDKNRNQTFAQTLTFSVRTPDCPQSKRPRDFYLYKYFSLLFNSVFRRCLYGAGNAYVCTFFVYVCIFLCQATHLHALLNQIDALVYSNFILISPD